MRRAIDLRAELAIPLPGPSGGAGRSRKNLAQVQCEQHPMRRIIAIASGVLALLVIAMMVSVWHATQEPVTRTPGPLETGRAGLHAKLEEARKTEGQAEQQAWNSPAQLRALIQGHEQRIEKLKDNKEAAEIVAYDRDAVDRLEKRIANLAEQEAARAEAAKEAAQQAAKQATQPAQQQ